MKIKKISFFVIIIFCVVTIFVVIKKTNTKDIGLGYTADDIESSLPKRVVFVKDNTQIVVDLFPFDLDRYESSTFFFENFESVLVSKGYKKGKMFIDWGGDSFFLYIFIKSNNLELFAFRKGFGQPIFEFVSSITTPNIDTLITDIENDVSKNTDINIQ